MTRAEADRRWYEANGCDHAHCPTGHPKPQPELVGGRMLCMRCWFERRREVEVVPCTPLTCDEAAPA